MKIKYFFSFLPYLFIILTCVACTYIPKEVSAVGSFQKEKYLGKWYEIARIDFKYEKDLNNTTAEYTLKDDGMIKVTNKGYNTKKGKWEQSVGKAKFVDSDSIGMLKVSFFGPFYSGYNVLALDSEYQYALVGGSSFKFLWILSKNTTIPESIKEKYLKNAEDYGCHTKDLLWVTHNDQQ